MKKFSREWFAAQGARGGRIGGKSKSAKKRAAAQVSITHANQVRLQLQLDKIK